MKRTNNQVSMNEMMIDVQPPVLPPIPAPSHGDGILLEAEKIQINICTELFIDMGFDREKAEEMYAYVLELVKRHDVPKGA